MGAIPASRAAQRAQRRRIGLMQPRWRVVPSPLSMAAARARRAAERAREEATKS